MVLANGLAPLHDEFKLKGANIVGLAGMQQGPKVAAHLAYPELKEKAVYGLLKLVIVERRHVYKG